MASVYGGRFVFVGIAIPCFRSGHDYKNYASARVCTYIGRDLIVSGTMVIALYRIKRRLESRIKYDNIIDQLETARRQNAEFLSNVSHELRTPINMVLGISEVIQEKTVSPEVRVDIESIKLAGKRLSDQINNMLDYTEIVEGRLTPSKEPYMFTSIFNDIITLTAMQSKKPQLEMIFDLAPGIPSILLGDAEKISHVLKIILENSIKFTEEGGIYVCVDSRQESYGTNLIIDICDTGIGMTDGQIAKMCDDFYQADTGSTALPEDWDWEFPLPRDFFMPWVDLFILKVMNRWGRRFILPFLRG